jgi:hypothetical protein
MKLSVLLKINFFTSVIASIVSSPFVYLVELVGQTQIWILLNFAKPTNLEL